MSINYYVDQFWDDASDLKLKHVLAGGPWKVLSLISLYLFLVLRAGPQFMRHRAPYQLTNVNKFYNVSNIILNAIVTAYCFYYTRMTIDCWKCPTSQVDRNMVYLWAYGLLPMKLYDFLDTIFFVLRTKDNQVTTLHVVHHAFMPFAIWLATKYTLNLYFQILPCLNCLVHTVMYTYYYMAADPYYKPYLWWKRHLTTMQLVQFGFFVLMGLRVTFTPGCNQVPTILVCIAWTFGAIIIYGFARFYYNSYVQNDKRKQPLENNNEPSFKSKYN